MNFNNRKKINNPISKSEELLQAALNGELDRKSPVVISKSEFQKNQKLKGIKLLLKKIIATFGKRRNYGKK